jgi:RNA polymerase sigma-70 factor (ECF subfamily)
LSGSHPANGVVELEASAATDAKLVAQARQGDMRAFERLYRLYHRKIFGLCLRMTRQHETAEDCVQKTFVKAWRNLALFEGRSAFSSWLYRIAVNEVLSLTRRQRGDTEAYDELDEESVHSPALEPATGGLMDVEHALDKLPAGARQVVVLQAIYGHTHEEVAEMLGIAVGTCKAQLHRGRKLLRQLLDLPETMDA